MVKVWIQYCAAGVAMIPAGLLYLNLLNSHIPDGVAFARAVMVALTLGLGTWFLVAHWIHLPKRDAALTWSGEQSLSISSTYQGTVAIVQFHWKDTEDIPAYPVAPITFGSLQALLPA
jgi:hypothetical protein